jgi:hypothetical protein
MPCPQRMRLAPARLEPQLRQSQSRFAEEAKLTKGAGAGGRDWLPTVPRLGQGGFVFVFQAGPWVYRTRC